LEVRERDMLIPVGTRGVTSGVLTFPVGGQKRIAVIVAHGAGNDMNTQLITSFCRGLAASGFPALRFNFLYTEHGRKFPDRQEVLVETWEAVYLFARKELGTAIDLWFAAGKSMGGRVASQMVADNLLPVHGLIFLGYPLHPADNQEKLRDTHLYHIRIPMLFFAGTRDPLCNMVKLKGVLDNLRAPWELSVIDGGDHSFHLPKSAGLTEEDIFSRITKMSLEWLSRPIAGA